MNIETEYIVWCGWDGDTYQACYDVLPVGKQARHWVMYEVGRFGGPTAQQEARAHAVRHFTDSGGAGWRFSPNW